MTTPSPPAPKEEREALVASMAAENRELRERIETWHRWVKAALFGSELPESVLERIASDHVDLASASPTPTTEAPGEETDA